MALVRLCGCMLRNRSNRAARLSTTAAGTSNLAKAVMVLEMSVSAATCKRCWYFSPVLAPLSIKNTRSSCWANCTTNGNGRPWPRSSSHAAIWMSYPTGHRSRWRSRKSMEKRLKRHSIRHSFNAFSTYRCTQRAQFADDDQIDHDKTEHVYQDEAEVVVSTDDEIVEKYTDNFADQRIGGGVEFVRIRLGDGNRIPYGRYSRVDDGDRFDADMFDEQQAVDFHQHQLEQMLLVEQQSRIRS
ncbi:hypothetical protein T07_2407 [Trichinella nelsoni]|uniref:Uncharacterized protein n=1 Tax=Trichinella nelsoni TaxID=6336 RepID=A0A0V0RXK6_9BILA|nr:hypothetical protein T07_2407 [Trichinella nelsoni]